MATRVPPVLFRKHPDGGYFCMVRGVSFGWVRRIPGGWLCTFGEHRAEGETRLKAYARCYRLSEPV